MKSVYTFIKNRFLIILISGGLALSFYWFQWRPNRIKHDCSWIKVHVDKVPAQRAKTPQEVYAEYLKTHTPAELDQAIGAAKGQIILQPRYKSIFFENLWEESTKQIGLELIYGRKAIPEKPGYDYWQEATPKEYAFCLHDKGI